MSGPWTKAHAEAARERIEELGDLRAGQGEWVYRETLLAAVDDEDALLAAFTLAGEDAAQEIARIRERVAKPMLTATAPDKPLPPVGSWEAVVAALGAYLLAHGWLPVERLPTMPDWAEAGDWTPPEDRGNPWDLDDAIEEQRERDQRGGGA